MFIVPGQNDIVIECYDQDIGKDDFIGSANLSLAEVFRTGFFDTR